MSVTISDHQVEMRPPQVTARTRLRVWSRSGPTRSTALLLAPAAGSNLDEPALSTLGRGLSARGVVVGAFDFAYQHARRRPPDRRDRLERAFHDALSVFAGLTGAQRHVLGGRSLGGRIASHLAASGTGAGVLALAYPLHPGGEPDPLRTAHWPDITVPVLFVHGDRDRLCPVSALAGARATWLRNAPSTVHVVAGADHGFRVRARDPRTAAEVAAELVATVDRWISCTFEEDGHG
ncbi:MAG TPA: alpha/beta family hydrolase [Euzebyales bacterium]|nr:alpha/beta family hydrolase [Euzebyales bacterium]